MLVRKISLRTIKNFSGNETIEAAINSFSASSPIGTSRSSFEAPALPAKKSIKNFHKIKNEFLGDFSQKSFDELLRNYSGRIGSTATAALSLAFFKSEKPKSTFPHLLGNIAGGWKHNNSAFIQEILTMPGAKTIAEEIEINMEIWADAGRAAKAKKTNIESAWII